VPAVALIQPTPERFIASGQQFQAINSADSRPELMARFYPLVQTFNTRSDVFGAWILMRAYPSDDFSKGPQQQVRMFVLMDRSQMRSASDSPAIVFSKIE